MSQITPLQNLPKWLGQTDKQNEKNDRQDLTGLLKAKQQADQLSHAARAPVKTDVFNPHQLSTAAVQRYQAAYQYSETMSLQIETREGDKVTVDFRQLYMQYQEFNRQQMTEQGPKGVRQFESREMLEMTALEERFAFSVEGDLNEDELRAIFEVFEQVDELANNFFNGDIEKAFQQAIDLKIDFGQLKSINLDLTRSETRAVSYQQGALAQYRDVQKAGESAEKYGVEMGELAPYLQAWQSAIEKLDELFANSQKMFDDMMAGSLAQRFPEQDSREGWFERVQKFHQELAEAFAEKSAKIASQEGENEDLDTAAKA
ncbi:hypothetical protein JX580_08595 [Thiomicrospira microaerophila]|uniref:hypothetical protein n=1 Tax=Thiomicrospira microaerophila TaxID=406020 RepID=UPI00200BAC83|nr:hypothetical protein [Thiomicrospira microaerophila]UQB41724.1 hypothetical protein JX580_08595 [Thiomicrospira microaerophila]